MKRKDISLAGIAYSLPHPFFLLTVGDDQGMAQDANSGFVAVAESQKDGRYIWDIGTLRVVGKL